MNTLPEKEVVSAFVNRALPRGPIPLARSVESGDPTAGIHYGFNHVDWKAGIDPTKLSDLIKKRGSQPFPLWPPDLFAVVATLLDQSASYLHMVYKTAGAVEPDHSTDHWPLIPEEIFERTKAKDSPLAFCSKTIKACRLIGALWRSGCLFISGTGFAIKKNGIKPDNKISNKKVLYNLSENFHPSIEDLATKYRTEFKNNDVDDLIVSITSLMENQRFDCGTEPLDIRKATLTECRPDLEWSNLYRFICDHLQSGVLLEHFDRSKSRAVAPKDEQSSYSGACEVVVCQWALEFISSLWQELISCDEPYSIPRREWGDKLSNWQVASSLLLIIADEAARGLGFSTPRDPTVDPDDSVAPNNSDQESADEILRNAAASSAVMGMGCRDLWQVHSALLAASKDHEGRDRSPQKPRNLARSVDESIASVMPKARTPMTGCTIRSLSHHLALLPPKSRIRTRWIQQKPLTPVDDFSTFGLLLIPFPYEIRSEDIEPIHLDSEGPDAGWGRFSVHANWLRRNPENPKKRLSANSYSAKLWEFVKELVCDQPAGSVNGIVFPECALDFKAFSELAERIASSDDGRFTSIILLTSGLVDAPADPHQPNHKISEGNFVATYMRHQGEPEWYSKSIRSKHHRWSLDKSQLASYALSGRLSPDRIWWENIDLPPREMAFFEFSQGAVLTSLICEDLARIDPCQIALRAIGPNLTLVLLMDSAQLTSRWPAQYAGVLADDPGTSVLTLTSFGLLRRSNLSEGYDSREIALWREPLGGQSRSIKLPKGYHAQLLSLRPEKTREITIDGRGDAGSAVAWRLGGVVPIRSAVKPPGYPSDP